mgnify:CR=1 FL=1
MKNSAYYLKLLLFICVLFLNGCATIIFNSIPLKDISKTSGQYHVGTQTLYLVDSSRSMWFSDDISRPREISVKIWYPANEMNLIKKARYLDDSELIGEALSERLGVPKALMRRAKGIKCNSWLNAMPIKGNFPILIYSHGHQSLKIANTFQAEELASNGYIVIAPDHTYDAAITILEDKSIIYSKSKLPNNDQQASKQEMKNIVEKQLKIRTIDISFLISKMNQEFSLNNQFVGSADTNRIGIFGHSFGGCTSVMSAFNDNRIDAVLGLDAYFLPLSESVINKDMNKPFAHIGQISWGNSNNYKVMEALGKKNSKSFIHFSIEGSRHYDFTDFSQFTRLTKKFGSGDISPKKIRKIMNMIMIDFFNSKLKSGIKFNPEIYSRVFPEINHYIY